jgi:hypothetical protein
LGAVSGIRKARQRLYHSGKLLRDEFTLNYEGITNHAVIVMSELSELGTAPSPTTAATAATGSASASAATAATGSASSGDAPPPAETMVVAFMLSGSVRIDLVLTPSDTIDNIKGQIQHATGVPPIKQEVFLGGVKLDPRNTVESYKIDAFDVVQVILL